MKHLKRYAACVTGLLATVVTCNILWIHTKMMLDDVLFYSFSVGFFAFMLIAFLLDIDH
jgi:hypothetical protein